MILFWRRTDVSGLERLDLSDGDGGMRARSTVLTVEGGGARLEYDWRLDADWRTRSLEVWRHDAGGTRQLRLERATRGWLVDGVPRDDLAEAEEPDLSFTPFCNTLPIRRLARASGAALTLDVAYVDGDDLSLTPSRQRYLRRSAELVRYIDLGTARGFEADLTIDGDGLVIRYEGLFERVAPEARS